MPEFDLIRRLQNAICIQPDQDAATCVVGIGDDGAVLDVPEGKQLVVCTDTLVSGIHFPVATRPAAIGHKALAVNLSDLAAMGAKPAWFFMALTIPSEDQKWLDSFARGMAELAQQSLVLLAGGDVTTGPLSITVTALGLVDVGCALQRSGAVVGDLVVISGRPGAAAHALNQLSKGQVPQTGDLAALEYPVARLKLGQSLRGIASACIDISDGLAADFGHILRQSGVGAEIQLADLPCPDSMSILSDPQRWSLQLAGGDDYELCFTLPSTRAHELAGLSESSGVELTVIGTIGQQRELVFRTKDGSRFKPEKLGFRHFDTTEETTP